MASNQISATYGKKCQGRADDASKGYAGGERGGFFANRDLWFQDVEASIFC